jgi:hypothetical protein
MVTKRMTVRAKTGIGSRQESALKKTQNERKIYFSWREPIKKLEWEKKLVKLLNIKRSSEAHIEEDEDEGQNALKRVYSRRNS